MYIPELLRSPFAKEKFDGPQRGIKNSYRLSDVKDLPVPLPPLAEQQRIVAKVDELMALCDELETEISKKASTHTLYLSEEIHRALNGIENLIPGTDGRLLKSGGIN